MDKLIAISLLLASMSAFSSEDNLVAEMKDMDSKVFDSFNRCADEQQLKLHESYFADKVEFYHDNGGVTWDRQSMINNTKNYACGKYTRSLVEESFQAYPIKDFGAITEGVHKFCSQETGSCDGKAKFLMVWQHTNGQWQVTRVVSYGHLPN
ncbi:nuclear transport factor 2 family protein [Shewanella xiamenensis]|uniref:nuclear transport factor 2 family protein n=1 Tax=Shewanella xiamenensis TaxID=332186 RepID=UPI0020B12093|nr:nuclear transport factor 2 family protein [Shewanella xiamenensis]